MQLTFLTTDELAARIKYTPRHIRRHFVDHTLFEGVHYTRPFGGKKILFIWERIEEELMGSTASTGIPMAAGGFCHG